MADLHNAMTLDSELCGVRDHRFDSKVHHYRGIPYASISERFAKPVLATNWRECGLDFKEYGPRCPQPAFNIESSMGVPADVEQNEPAEEDEFACCNLNVTCPDIATGRQLPVYLWIHGGGQATSFPSAHHRLGDPGPLVAQSIEINKPIILITVNYRLNVFGFGDPEGANVNLALQDQAMAMRWVQDYIGLFGGNPVGLSACFVRFVVTKLEQENISIGGESAGAIYTHGLLAMNVRPRRAILASGSLYLTPPQDRRKCFKLLRFIEHSLSLNRPQDSVLSEQTSGEWLLRTAPAEELVKIIQDAGIYSWWMFDSPLGHWKDDVKVFGNVEAVLLSDCEEEGAPYDSRLRRRTKEEIIDAFQTLPEAEFTALASAYGLEAAQRDYEKCVRMATTFITDARFTLWSQEIWNQINSAKVKAYLCHYDEVNPFGPWPTLGYPIAHHAVDLLAAFGGYDDEVNAATREAGRLLRGKWIDFINGEEPWASDVIYCIGPDGKNGPVPKAEELDLDSTTTRRRQANFKILKKIGLDSLTRVWQHLLPTAGMDGREV